MTLYAHVRPPDSPSHAMTTPVLFALGPIDDEARIEALRKVLGTQQFATVRRGAFLLVEVTFGALQLPWLLELIGDVPFVASADSSAPTEQANEEWFQAHKTEFAAGEHVVVQECEAKLRTHSHEQCYAFLEAHGNSDTVCHKMVRFGCEIASIDQLV